MLTKNNLRLVQGTIFFIIIIVIFYLYKIAFNNKIILFYKPECSHCEELKPTWDKFTSNMLLSLDVMTKAYDVTLDKNKDISANFNFTTVPHIVKVKNNIRTVYSGERTILDITKWAKE